MLDVVRKSYSDDSNVNLRSMTRIAMAKQLQGRRKSGFHGGSAAADHAECLRVLGEFVAYVEQADLCGDDTIQIPSALWPTYLKARQLVRDNEAENQQVRNRRHIGLIDRFPNARRPAIPS